MIRANVLCSSLHHLNKLGIQLTVRFLDLLFAYPKALPGKLAVIKLLLIKKNRFILLLSDVCNDVVHRSLLAGVAGRIPLLQKLQKLFL